MRFRTAATTAAAIAAAGVLVLTGCADSARPRGRSRPTLRRARRCPYEDGTTMAELADAGTITIGTKFAQPLFGLAGPDGIPVGFDIEIGKIIAAPARHRAGGHRVGRDRVGEP